MGKVELVLGARFERQVGIGLTTPTSPTPFLYDTTALTLEAKAAATALAFQASLGPLGLFIKNGTAALQSRTDRDGNPATIDPAAFTVRLAPDPTDHRYRFSEL